MNKGNLILGNDLVSGIFFFNVWFLLCFVTPRIKSMASGYEANGLLSYLLVLSPAHTLERK